MLVLLCTAAAHAQIPDLAVRPAFVALPAAQQAWLQALSSQPLRAPAQVHFFGLTATLDLYADRALTKDRSSLPATPHAVGAPGDYGGHLAVLTVHASEGAVWDVEIGGIRGWVRRSDLRADSLVVARPDGSLVHDLFPTCMAGGSRCRMNLGAAGGQPVVRFRYVDSYRGDGERWFALVLDPERGAFTDWLPADVGPSEAPLGRVLSPPALARISGELGLDRTGFVVGEGGALVERALFYQPLTADRPAIAAGGWVITNSAVSSGASPVRP